MAEYQTLKLNSDFRRTYGRGKSAADPVLVTYALRNRYGVMRIGITTGKKLGNAVERNRCRRIIRAAFRQLEGECCGGWDIVFVARHKTVSRKSTDIERSMRKQLGALGVIGISAGVKVVKMKDILIKLIQFYRKHISPQLPDMCRYYPTCSQYAIEALEIHGAFKGSLLTVARLLRCNILFPGGYDPVPPKRDKKSNRRTHK